MNHCYVLTIVTSILWYRTGIAHANVVTRMVNLLHEFDRLRAYHQRHAVARLSSRSLRCHHPYRSCVDSGAGRTTLTLLDKFAIGCNVGCMRPTIPRSSRYLVRDAGEHAWEPHMSRTRAWSIESFYKLNDTLSTKPGSQCNGLPF